MNRKALLAGGLAAALAVAAAALAYFLPAPDTRPVFDEGDLHVCLNQDGTVELTWPEAPGAAGYRLEVQGSGENQRLTFDHDAAGVALEGLTLPMEIRVDAVAEGKNLLGMAREVTGSRSLEAKVEPVELSAPRVTAVPGPGKLSLSWDSAGTLYEVFKLEGGYPVHVASTDGLNLQLNVGREGDLAMPSYSQPLAVNVRAGFQGEGYVLCGPASNLITVERQDLLGDDLNLICRETEPMHYALEWDETQGEFYELYQWSGEDWTLLDTLSPKEHFSQDLGRLVSGSRHRYQVVAKDRNGTVRSSEEADFFASIDPLYATVWPIIDQPFYEKADKGSASLGKIPGGTALCVLEETGDWFQVRYKDKYGYVDSRFCMINLPEYVGDHCEYNITNSYRSVFKVHESPVALITDQVISGFEHIQTLDEHFLVPYLYPCAKKLLSAAQAAEADGYRLRIYEAFRPNEATRFLYDTTAAQLDWAALVYSFEDDEGNPLEEDADPRILDPVTGWVVDLMDGLLIDPETGEKISREELLEASGEGDGTADGDTSDGLTSSGDGTTSSDSGTTTSGDGTASSDSGTGNPGDAGGSTDDSGDTGGASSPPTFITLPPEGGDETGLQFSGTTPSDSGNTPPNSGDTPGEGDGDGEGDEVPEYDTYFKIMTDNGRFRLGSFLAQVTSAHNRGIALDLTLAEIDSGEELEMQSAIHDLSWYSATYRNNDNAKLLEKYMTGVGMRGLTSEWWHFQDDETRQSIGLSGYLYKGVSLAGWTRDEKGWRYRDEDGAFLRNTSQTVDGKRYAFDREGYASQ